MIREIRNANQVTEKELKKLKNFQLKCKEKKLAEDKRSNKNKIDPDEIPDLMLADEHVMPAKAYDS